MKASRKEMIAYLTDKLLRYIDKFGTTDQRTVRVSQRLDKFIVAEQLELGGRV